MTKTENSKHYDLEERTLKFAHRVRIYVSKLPKTIANLEDGRQLIDSSGSVGANYIEANEALSRKDFLMRIKICRKEAKESKYWLALIVPTKELEMEKNALSQEAFELVKIFNAIVEKTK